MADKWFEFNRPFTFTPDEDRRASVHYQPGKPYRVRQQCIDKALAAGAGRIVDTPQGDPRRGQQAQNIELRSPQNEAPPIAQNSPGGTGQGGGGERQEPFEDGEEGGGDEPADG